MTKPPGMEADQEVVLRGGSTLILDEYGTAQVRGPQPAARRGRTKRLATRSQRLDYLWRQGVFDEGHSFAARLATIHRLRASEDYVSARRSGDGDETQPGPDPVATTSASATATCSRFAIRASPARNVLIDFGSSEASGFSPDLLTIAEQIKVDCGGKLDMVVATHRHSDHISGFGGRPGEVIASLDPQLVDPAVDGRPGARRRRTGPRRRERRARAREPRRSPHACPTCRRSPRRRGSVPNSKTTRRPQDLVRASPVPRR